MMLRSLLFVPGDDERKQEKAVATAADAVIFDLEDSVAPARLSLARGLVAAFLAARANRGQQQLWVRVNSLSSGRLLGDLSAVITGAPDGVILPKVSDPTELREVHHYLSALEEHLGRPPQSTRVIAVATETPRAVFGLGAYSAGAPRLAGLTWGAEDLCTGLGASSKVDADGGLAFTYEMVRSMCLLAARASGVQPIDTLYAAFNDLQGLRQNSERARRDGFTGKIAIHPDQVDVINAAFSPSKEEIERAARIVEAFSRSPASGVVSLGGEMLDLPHLLQARSVLDRANRV
jgi:citrate lyase subunit beta/citryl-CoA lyase